MNFFSSKPLTKGAEERVTRQANDFLDQFSTEFSKFYNTSVLKQVKDESNDANDGIQIPKAPANSDPIKKGLLSKVSYIFTSHSMLVLIFPIK